ncbi:hypothetical protein BD289DRAFT_103251 [Coniella lustricola]|uniref:Uncharacterized protein n=1 Tax=Coniella lustricola TaxID=2025994 RepID=A0A2T2ZXZ3_9PEZI|nr:hypothetical protein BD289DRAFT_103251 [Coniella lustricola]
MASKYTMEPLNMYNLSILPTYRRMRGRSIKNRRSLAPYKPSACFTCTPRMRDAENYVTCLHTIFQPHHSPSSVSFFLLSRFDQLPKVAFSPYRKVLIWGCRRGGASVPCNMKVFVPLRGPCSALGFWVFTMVVCRSTMSHQGADKARGGGASLS